MITSETPGHAILSANGEMLESDRIRDSVCRRSKQFPRFADLCSQKYRKVSEARRLKNQFRKDKMALTEDVVLIVEAVLLLVLFGAVYRYPLSRLCCVLLSAGGVFGVHEIFGNYPWEPWNSGSDVIGRSTMRAVRA